MTQHPTRAPAGLSRARLSPREPALKLEMVSDALGADGSMDLRHTAYGGNLSPPLRWTPVEGAGAYAIIMEDPDAAARDTPFVHWLIWNIPTSFWSLPEGVPADERPVTPQGAVQGRNDSGASGYYGPRPPAGGGRHHYHFQIFALDGPLFLHREASIRALVDAMKGRVLAKGELVGRFAAPRTQ